MTLYHIRRLRRLVQLYKNSSIKDSWGGGCEPAEAERRRRVYNESRDKLFNHIDEMEKSCSGS